MTVVLMLGSAPIAAQAAFWPREPFDKIVAINNAHAIRADWDHLIYPWDFPRTSLPELGSGQTQIDETAFVPAQNAYGGFVYAGGTMAFTAAYWILHKLKPRVLAVFGCDMVYPAKGPTHFYGTGQPDPLRNDITLRSLEAKSARLMIHAAAQGCAVINLSNGPSRLIFPRAEKEHAPHARPQTYDADVVARAMSLEARLGYYVPSGLYWQEAGRFDPAEIDALDTIWLEAASAKLAKAC